MSQFIRHNGVVYDNVSGRIVFRGSYEDCQAWIDDPLALAYQQGLKLLEALEKRK